MIVLDTNVVSELVRAAEADRRVLTWSRSLAERPATTVITRAEMLAGIAVLPAGRRRDRMTEGVESIFSGLGVVLPLMTECAPEFAAVLALRRDIGRPIEPMDALIASICRVAGATLATRNTVDFEGIGLDLVNPWD